MEKVNDILSKLRIPSASHGKHTHKFSFPILETCEWMTPQPIYTRELRKGDSIDWTNALFGRTDALLNPAFVTGQYHYRFFFVPYRLVMPSYENWKEKTMYTFPNGESTTPSTKRVIDWTNFQTVFITVASGYAEVVDDPLPDRSNFDFYFYDGRDSVAYKFTSAGRRVYQLLRGLGYQFNFVGDSSIDHVDFLPILCWMQVFIDWIFPDQYADISQVYINYKKILVDNNPVMEYNPRNVAILIQLLSYSTRLFYLDDTLSSVWDTPAIGYGQPSLNDDSYFSIKDITLPETPTSQVDNNFDSGGSAVVENDGAGNLSRFTQFVIDALQSANNWLLRRKLAGGRLIHRYLASHGVTLPNMQSYTSFALGHKTISLHVGDVENNSNTNLGELAGKGVVRTENDDLIHCDYTADEPGLFMLIRYVMPDCRIPLQELPSIRKITAFDNFTNEFQKLGVEGIDKRVLYCPPSGVLNNVGTFGFAPRYWYEAAEFPRLLGDFELSSQGAAQLAQYHTFRTINELGIDADDIHHSLNFLRAYDVSDYNRIFYNGEGSNFRNYMFCRVILKNDKLPNGDSFDWDDDELNAKVDLVSKSNV